MKKRIVIAIDGPAGSGKSTIARLVAKRLKILYIDSGAMYRAYTWRFIQDALNIEDTNAVAELLENTSVKFENTDSGILIFVNDKDVTKEIRAREVTAKVSLVARNQAVRQKVTEKLRELAGEQSVVMEGRDIGTVVLPNADLKFFVSASLEERARRRQKDFSLSGVETDFEIMKNEIERRDKKDATRELAPLNKAEDAIFLDTTTQTIDESVDFVLSRAQESFV